MNKLCSSCGLEKSMEEFPKDKTRKGGLSYICKLCLNIKSKNIYDNLNDEVKEKMIKRGNLLKRQNVARSILNRSRVRAKSKGWEFSLTIEDIIIPEICPVLGIPLKVHEGIRGDGRHDGSPSIDRFNSSKGYTKDNIRIISWRANCLKKNGTVEEFEAILKYMKNEI